MTTNLSAHTPTETPIPTGGDRGLGWRMRAEIGGHLLLSF